MFVLVGMMDLVYMEILVLLDNVFYNVFQLVIIVIQPHVNVFKIVQQDLINLIKLWSALLPAHHNPYCLLQTIPINANKLAQMPNIRILQIEHVYQHVLLEHIKIIQVCHVLRIVRKIH